MICPRCHGAGRVDSVHEQTGIPAEVAALVAPVYIPSRRCGECMGRGEVGACLCILNGKGDDCDCKCHRWKPDDLKEER